MRKIQIYDTTLRDGTQGEGFALSLDDKLRIAERHEQRQCMVKIIPLCKGSVFENTGGDTGVFRPVQALGGRDVADDVVDFDIQLTGPAGIDQCLQVAAGARDQHACLHRPGHAL